MPLTGLYAETDHVLGHELVHSFQYDIAFAKGDTIRFALGLLPLWLVASLACPGVDPAILNPRGVWKDKDAYDAAAEKLRGMFRKNFESNDFAKFGIEAVM